MDWKKLNTIFKEEKEKIEGGLADNKTLADIAAEHGKPIAHMIGRAHV